ncbi:hypothetical protein VPNG_06136 [Cytospora leucostoma]|uniref:Uncharacterized protein n=1 Tax=Cytospora leucostoma TaxID=1230097 RepID=A0A423WX44_9PEZI|nr:hypothetical protein VPNG_06136 [Cytospora leucostoma]
MTSFLAHPKMFSGKGPEELTSPQLLRLPAGAKKSIIIQVSVPACYEVGPILHKLSRKASISDLRCLTFNSTPPDTDAFVIERWLIQGKHTSLNASRAPKAHVDGSSACPDPNGIIRLQRAIRIPYVLKTRGRNTCELVRHAHGGVRGYSARWKRMNFKGYFPQSKK